MYIRDPYIIKTDDNRYLQEDATTANPVWGTKDTAMHICHYIGALTIQEKTGGYVL
ncbi:hypothetical protein [Nostoc sp. C052]|uniref:hypothetical protein n=1 Tax=Nostoc sp. C052 TaxID=2576902 RepID=UPI0015C35B09|nr:hypothetical protein [Nostoc sp. C052]